MLRPGKWTQKSYGVNEFSSSVYDGLDSPVWRETKNLDNNVIIESCPYEISKSHAKLPSGVANIQTTVWYGSKVRPPKGSRQNGRKKNLLKGIQRACSILLLESMVLLSKITVLKRLELIQFD